MPKAQASKVLNREDFIYSPIHSKRTSPSISTGLSETREYGSSTMRDSVFDQQTELASKGNNASEIVDVAKDHQVNFPHDVGQRESYRTKSGKELTQYQWDVYDFILKIPKGKVTTYKVVSESVGGSSRSVGGALKANPFSPYVPCHRIVASNFFIGGFFGQWAGRNSQFSAKGGSTKADQSEILRKINLLEEEGVFVDSRGFLVDGGKLVWRPT